MKDKEFLAEAASLSIEIDTVDGEAIARIVSDLRTPAPVSARAKKILE